MENTSPPLITEIEAFLSRHEMSAISFGRKVLRDPHFVRDLRAGRDLKMSTVDRVRGFMAEYDAPAEASGIAA